MYKLLALFCFLAVAFAAPAAEPEPEPSAPLRSPAFLPAVAYSPLGYAHLPAALPAAPLTYSAPLYAAYPGQYAYNHIY